MNTDDVVVGGEPLRWWKTCPWWPVGRAHRIHVGAAGHDRELVLNIDGYDWDEPIPTLVVDALRVLLPDDWKVDSRGSRIECHPSGHFAGGFVGPDVDLLDAAASALLAPMQSSSVGNHAK